MIRSISVEEIGSGNGSIAAGPFGSAVSSKFFAPNGVPMIRGSNLSTDVGVPLDESEYVFLPEKLASKFPRAIATPGDLVFTCWGTIEQVGWIPPSSRYVRYLVSNKQMRLRPDPMICDSRYLYYYFSSGLGQAEILERRIGSSVPGFNLGGLKSIQVPLPDLATQKNISATLAALDDKIELNRRMAATLEEMARALWRSWFVDFDPVRARAAGEAPAFMDEATAALFPDRFGADGLPEGWREGTCEDVAPLSTEKWSARLEPEMIRYVDLSAVSAGSIATPAEMASAVAPSRARMILRPGDTVIGTVRPGNRAFALIGEQGLTGSTGFAVLRPREAEDYTLTYVAATDSENIDRLAHLADGAAYPAVRPEVVAKSPLVVAPVSVRRAFGQVANPLLKRGQELQKESRTLATLRDALLPKLMSGELRVREAEALVAEVA